MQAPSLSLFKGDASSDEDYGSATEEPGSMWCAGDSSDDDDNCEFKGLGRRLACGSAMHLRRHAASLLRGDRDTIQPARRGVMDEVATEAA
eukprot:4958180-Pleurochrysis_carterae.AAC.1